MTAKPKSRKRAPRKKAAEKPPRKRAPPAPSASSAPQAPPEPARTTPPEPEPLAASAFSLPEVEFATRTPSALPERPRPLTRRAIFIDVENESHARRLEELLTALQIDRSSAATDVVASGNWRVISHETARLLAKNGALLVHSAPAVGVRDWSDLRIAVAAGAWLASARPGDRLDIVSSDRAFDAVGDVAASLGVEYHRHAQRAGDRAAPAAKPARAEAAARAPKSRRRGRGRAAAAPQATPAAAVADSQAPSQSAAAPALPVETQTHVAPAPEEPRSATPQATVGRVAAPHDEVLAVVRALLQRSPGGVTLDAVAARLKEKGFERPPNSPRLVTRLRSMRDLKVSAQGKVMLAGHGSPAQPAKEPS